MRCACEIIAFKRITVCVSEEFSCVGIAQSLI